MFEAHIYSDSQANETVQGLPSVVPGKTYQCWHSNYQCNVRFWCSTGKRQGQTVLFIFIEYRNRDNSHGYKRLELPAEQLNREALTETISRYPLSNSLDPIKTESWCRSSVV